jgi:hypothetical protein
MHMLRHHAIQNFDFISKTVGRRITDEGSIKPEPAFPILMG